MKHHCAIIRDTVIILAVLICAVPLLAVGAAVWFYRAARNDQKIQKSINKP